MNEQPAGEPAGRVLALDLGSRRIGVAVCDDRRVLATALDTIKRVGDRPVEHRAIADAVAETGAVLVVVGLPYSLDGELGPAAKAMRSEIKALGRFLPVPVVTHDERLTTVTAHDELSRGGVGGRKRREVVDQVAAAVILQDWLDRNR